MNMYFRNILVEYLKTLKDKKFQIKNWKCKNSNYGFWSELIEILHFFFDDIPFIDYPQEQIGSILINKKELEAVLILIKKLNDLIEKIGSEKEDDEYINSLLWDKVVEAAGVVYEEIMKNPVDVEGKSTE